MDKPTSAGGNQRKGEEQEQQGGKKRAKSNYSDTATVLIGDDKTPFIVHRDLLCARSKFIAAALSKAWEENKTKQIHLTQPSPSAFKIYVESLYDGKANILDLATTCLDEIASKEKKHANEAWQLPFILCMLWAMGDFLDDITFRNDVISSLLRAIEEKKVKIGSTTASYIWEHVPSSSSLGRLSIDWICSLSLSLEFLDANEPKIPSEYRFAYLKYYVKRSKGNVCKRDLLRAKDADNYIEKVDQKTSTATTTNDGTKTT